MHDRMIATGVVAAYVRLTSQQMESFKAMPIYVGAMPDVKGMYNTISFAMKWDQPYSGHNRWTSGAHARRSYEDCP